MRVLIRFRTGDYSKWLRATVNLAIQGTIEKNKLPQRHAINYVNAVRSNISTGKFDAAYAPYNERYYHWKYFVFKSHGGFWFLKGNLYSSLSAFRHEDGWMGGIPAGIQVEGSSWFGQGFEGKPRYVAQYGRWMEYGRPGQPARPLFRPTFGEYKEGQALQEMNQSMIRLRNKWR